MARPLLVVILACVLVTSVSTEYNHSICGTEDWNQSNLRPLPSRLNHSALEKAWNTKRFAIIPPGRSDLNLTKVWNKCRKQVGSGFRCVIHSHRNWKKLGLGKMPLLIKTHKVGGSTFATILSRHIDQMAQEAKISLMECTKGGIRRGKGSCDSLTRGHFGKNMYQACGMVPANNNCAGRTHQVSVTLFREPLERWFSLYFFMLETQGTATSRMEMRMQSNAVGHYKAFEQWLSTPGDHHAHLYIEPIFYNAYEITCDLYGGCPDLPDNRTLKSRIALSNVQEIAITEHFDESLVMVALSLGWDPESVAYSDSSRERVSKLHRIIHVGNMPDEIKDKIRSSEMFKREDQLYRFALQLHKETKQSWGKECFERAMNRFKAKKKELDAETKETLIHRTLP